jgi:hypothetical protein
MFFKMLVKKKLTVERSDLRIAKYVPKLKEEFREMRVS